MCECLDWRLRWRMRNMIFIGLEIVQSVIQHQKVAAKLNAYLAIYQRDALKLPRQGERESGGRERRG